LVRLRLPDEARKAAEEAVSLDPNNARLHAYLQRLEAFLARRDGPVPEQSSAEP
jgi:hypothetical protein